MLSPLHIKATYKQWRRAVLASKGKGPWKGNRGSINRLFHAIDLRERRKQLLAKETQ